MDVDPIVIEHINALTADLIIVDPQDLPALSKIHDMLESIGHWATKSENNQVEQDVTSVKKQLELIMLDEVPNPDVVFKDISNTLGNIHGFINGDTAFYQDIKVIEPETVENVDAPPDSTQPEDIDQGIVEEFIIEATEHLEASDNNLLLIEKNSSDKDVINAVFRAFHTIKGVAGFLSLNDIRNLSHEAETLLDKARNGEVILEGNMIDIVFASADKMKELIESLKLSISNGRYPDPDPDVPLLIQQIKDTLEHNKNGVVFDFVQPVEKIEQPQSKKEQLPGMAKDNSGSLRVDAIRLDNLIDMIGELVIAETMIVQSLRQEIDQLETMDNKVTTILEDIIFQNNLGLLDKVTRELQKNGLALRMVPVKPTFQKMERIVRDVSKKIGKKVNFVISGADTELDKTVVDLIGDPLMHMLRNSVDHGIEESAEQRRKAGKDEVGTIELRAFHQGGNIFIQIIDDGKGLSQDKILNKALEKGIVTPKHNLTNSEINNLIFEPGFSTAEQVTSVSGRGVGMDVVKKNIESLRGSVDVQSEEGKGCTFTIRLPLTLSIIDGMVVSVGSERYIIPTLSVIETIRPGASDLSTMVGKGNMLDFHGEHIALFSLSKLFNVFGIKEDPTDAIVMVIESDGVRIGIMVDDILGQQQIVIKSLEGNMKKVKGVSGCAIMSDGQVGLIIDVHGITKLSMS